MNKEKLTPSSIAAMWKQGKEYQQQMNLISKWNTFIRFREGDHWTDKVMKKWKNFPFMTINQCDFVIENKKSNILSQSMSMVYYPASVPEGANDEVQEEFEAVANDYTDLTRNVWEEVDQSQLNEDAVDDALVLGTAFYHYYFDESYKGTKYKKASGKIGGQIIDPKDVVMGNPHLKPWEGQNQPYYIVKTYEPTEPLKQYAKKNGKDWQLITPDEDPDRQYDNETKENDSVDKSICYTYYHFCEGEVYWIKVTNSAVIQKNRRLSANDNKFLHYPVESLVFKARKKSSYGLSAIEDVISVQKGINFIYSMLAYGVQQTAWPKILAKAGALIGTNFTNEPGEVVTDHDNNNPGDSVKYMQPPNFSNMPPLLIDKLTQSMRQRTGATEVVAGEVLGANMAASAIIALQNQAKKPNEAYLKQLKATNERIGKIFEDFYKCYFILPRSVIKKDSKGKMTNKTITPSDYSDYDFKLDVEVGASGEFSEIGQAAFVQEMYAKGDLDKYQYVKYTPSALVPQELANDFRDEQEKMVEEEPKENGDNPMKAIMDQLTPEERQAVEANPELLNGLIGG